MRAGFSRLAAISLCALITSGCATLEPKPRDPTVLEQQTIQTRTFEEADDKAVLQGVIAMFQNDHFVVQHTDFSMGLLRAEQQSPATSADSPHAEKVWAAVATGILVAAAVALVVLAITRGKSAGRGGWSPPCDVGGSVTPAGLPAPHTLQWVMLDCTATVNRVSLHQTAVRFTFERRLIDNEGLVMSIEPIQDPLYYREAFAHLDNVLFIQKHVPA